MRVFRGVFLSFSPFAMYFILTFGFDEKYGNMAIITLAVRIGFMQMWKHAD